MKTTTTRRKTTEIEELAPYLRAIRDARPLGRDEERELARRARKGDGRAKDALVRQHLGLVVATARAQNRGGGVRLDELVQEGNLGLLRAVEKFDPDAGTRFATYAHWWIRAYVWRYLKQARSAVRPRSGTVARPDVSLDAPIGDEEDDLSLLDRMEDDAPGADEEYASAESDGRLRDSLARVRGRLGEVGWDIVHARLQRDPPETLEQIGRRWGISRERVRQLELQTKRFLRGYLERAREAELPEAA